MSLFSDRHDPVRVAPEVGTIPPDVRQAILDWFHKRGVSPEFLWQRVRELHGYGDHVQAGDDILARYGGEAAGRFGEALQRGRQMAYQKANAGFWITRGILSGVPPGIFLDALTEAIYDRERSGAINDHYGLGDEGIAYINELFERRGIAYRAKEDGSFEWFGDAGAAVVVTQPALDALADARLAGPRNDFETALGHLRKGAKKDMEQAVVEAGKAVESAMKSLLDEHAVARDEKDTAQKLWDRLRDASIVPKQTEALILSSPRIRNSFGAHGAGAQPHDVPPSLAAGAVGSAAAAIAYLAAQLP